jgi:hypothetical protein
VNSVLRLTLILAIIALAAIEAGTWWTIFGGKTSRRGWAFAICLIVIIVLFPATNSSPQFDWSDTIDLVGLTAGLMELALYSE